MSVEQLAAFLGCCTLINFAFLLLAAVFLALAKDFVVNTHARLFGIGESELPGIYFRYLAYYKIAIFVFNLTPYLALRIIA